MDAKPTGAGLGQKVDNEGNEVCHCPCQKEISSLRAEMTGIRALLHSHGITDNSMKPEHQNVTAEHEANETQDSSQTGNYVDTDCNAEESVAPTALLNDLVLRHLGSYLSVPDLLACRLLCKAWNAAFSITLRMRPIYLQVCRKDVNTLVSSVEKDPKLFPFPGYQLPDSMFEGKAQKPMKRFLTNYSHIFKRLQLPLSYDDFGFISRLAKCLSTYFPHVEELDMSTVTCSREKSMTARDLKVLSSELDQLCLPELKKLTLPFAVAENAGIQVLVTGLLRASPKLQNIEAFLPALTKTLVSTGKMDLVSTMFLAPSMVMSQYVELALTPPCKLSHLEVGDLLDYIVGAATRDAIWDAFVAVLSASRQTLKSFTMNDLGAQWKDLPVFPKLVSLKIRGDTGGCTHKYRLFPEDVSNAFPALKTVAIELKNPKSDTVVAPPQQDEILRKFLWDKPLLSVTSVKIHFAVHKDGMEFLGSIFPNTTSVWIDWEMSFGVRGPDFRLEDLWDVWTVPFKLQRLQINRFDPWAHQDFSLDSFLTGIPERVCRNLRKDKYAQLPMDASYYDALRGYPNMLNLKDSLRELVITLDYPPPQASQCRMERSQKLQLPTASSVSVFYGIKLMKPIAIYIAYDHRKLFSFIFKKFFAPIEGDVILCHQECEEPPYYTNIAF